MKNKLLEYKGYYVSINVSVEDECVFGKVEFINDSIVFGADTVTELKATFKAEIDDYLVFCAEVGKQPDKTITGSFNVRIGAELHKKCLIKAKQENIGLNDVIKKSVEHYVNTPNDIHNYINVNIHPRESSDVMTQSFNTASSYIWQPSKKENHGSH